MGREVIVGLLEQSSKTKEGFANVVPLAGDGQLVRSPDESRASIPLQGILFCHNAIDRIQGY